MFISKCRKCNPNNLSKKRIYLTHIKKTEFQVQLDPGAQTLQLGPNFYFYCTSLHWPYPQTDSPLGAEITPLFLLQFQVHWEREDTSLTTVPAKMSLNLTGSEWIIPEPRQCYDWSGAHLWSKGLINTTCMD